jgi:NAD(P)H-dependent FMN reductase
MKVVVVSGSPRRNANTQLIMKYVVQYTKTKNVDVKFINLSDGQIECYRGPEEEYNDATKNAANDLMNADIWLIGSPIYNSFFSSALKNLFEYVNYKKTEGKVAGMIIVAAGNIGFIAVQTLITQLFSYFRVITNPQAVFLTTEVISGDGFLDEDAKKRLKEMIDGTLEMAIKFRKI